MSVISAPKEQHGCIGGRIACSKMLYSFDSYTQRNPIVAIKKMGQGYKHKKPMSYGIAMGLEPRPTRINMSGARKSHACTENIYS